MSVGFHVRFDDVQAVDGYARTKLSDMQTKLESLWTAIEALVNAPGLEGAAGEKARAYLGDVHGLLYSSLQTVLTEYQQLLLSYKDGYQTTVDSDPHAEFDEDELLRVEDAVRRRAEEFEAEAAELESAVESVGDLLTFFGPQNAGRVSADLRQVGVEARQTREAVGEYEYAHSRDLVGVREQLARINAVLDEYTASGSLMTSYDRDALGSNAAVVAMFEGTLAMQAAQADRAPSMAGVYAREEDRAAVLDAEAAAERAKWGWVKAVGAVVTIAVGVVAIVASAGAATPLVIGAAGVAATMFGASDLIEAGQDIYYGSRGDAYTAAFNPMRDTVFAGNQTLYDAVGFAVCAVAGAAMPLAQAAKLGALPRTAVVRAVVREGVEDLAAQKATEWAMPHLGAEGGLAAAMLGGAAMGPSARAALRAPGGAPGKAPSPTAGGGSAVLSALQRQKIAMYDHLFIRHANKPWLQKMFDGSRFNWERAHAYEFNEVAITRVGRGRPVRLDSYTPDGAVVSRKATQLAEINADTAKRYIDEAVAKYRPRTEDITIADTPANRIQFADQPDLIGKKLEGKLTLEVPTQKAPIPQDILDYASLHDVAIVQVERIR